MLKSCGETRTVVAKVADFGLSVKMDATETHVSSVFQVRRWLGGRATGLLSSVMPMSCPMSCHWSCPSFVVPSVMHSVMSFDESFVMPFICRANGYVFCHADVLSTMMCHWSCHINPPSSCQLLQSRAAC
jgi:hypothetical protein